MVGTSIKKKKLYLFFDKYNEGLRFLKTTTSSSNIMNTQYLL